MPKTVPVVSVYEVFSLPPFVSCMPIAKVSGHLERYREWLTGTFMKTKSWNHWNIEAASMLPPNGSCILAFFVSMAEVQ